MKTQDSFNIALELITAIESRYNTTFKDSSKTIWAKELSSFNESQLNKAYQSFKVEYESLPFQFAVSAGLIKQLKPTFTVATVEERIFAALKDGSPYEFLRKISPKLLSLVEQANVFDRALTTEQQGRRVKNVAFQFIEWKKNQGKGFEQPEPKQKLLPEKTVWERSDNPFKGMSVKEMAEAARKKLED